MSLVIKIKTALNLGAVNLWRVFTYRLGIKLGINPVKRLKAVIGDGDLFLPVTEDAQTTLPVNTSWLDKQCYFGWFKTPVKDTPEWEQNCFTGTAVFADQPWWQIPDFDPKLGDIKTVWEASRFDWVVCFTQAALAGDSGYITKLNGWLADWLQRNPAYMGPNWKCGQEASIRVMHLALAALLLQQQKVTTIELQQLIAAHLARIAPTIRYAIGQDNNHGTSEAAALFIGGSWLALYGHPQALKWQKMGRKWLENRAHCLIEQDGSFSQYSATYHRVMLDTYAFVEVWRRSLSLPAFSGKLKTKLAAATLWLYNLPGVAFGDVANLGANDGARLIPLADSDYRDCRPSVQLASALFLNKQAFVGDGIWNAPLKWLQLPMPSSVVGEPVSQQYDNGGYVLLRRNDAAALLRYPRFGFRPGQADALHLDFWLAGVNVLRDGGSYSYNSTPEMVSYFSGTASHNTAQFDNRDQMPKLSRFLFGEWLTTNYLRPLSITDSSVNFAAGYTDYRGASHKRHVMLANNLLTVNDELAGFKQSAVIRWRLVPGDWLLEGNSVTNGKIRLNIRSQSAFSLRLFEGLESRYYLQTSPLPVLELCTIEPGTFTTELFF
ncbi:heparinase II/III-family protein [Shewanella xiamenensis]|uniref:heparinase II/III family protein n=1 Tax=Shewanella xiamenensis TaxID=332186 RepID=UPI00313DC847